jgi:amidase
MAGADPEDPATADAPTRAVADYTANLAADALAGRRIGVVRSYYGAGSNPDVEAILASSIKALQGGGAEIVDPINLDTKGMGQAEDVVLLYEFKADLDAYLEKSKAPIRTLAGIVEFNKSHADQVMPFFGQEYMLQALDKGPLTDTEYLDALEQSRGIARKALDTALADNRLDALIVVSNGPAWMTDHVNGDSFSIGSSSYAAVSGYPSITVPAGFVSGLPIGLSFIGAAWSDKQLIELAYAFEQATGARRAPEL